MAVTEEQLIEVIFGIARAQADLIRAIGNERNDMQYSAKLSRFLPPAPRDPKLGNL